MTGTLGRTGSVAAAVLALVWLTAGCQQESIKITTYHFERGGEIEIVCFCESNTGVMEAREMDLCLPEEDNENCGPYAFVLQTNRDEIGIVNIRYERLVDSDVRVPFNTFNHTGRGPSDIAATPDGKTLFVTHVGDPFVAVYNTDELLGEFLADYETIPMPGPSTSIVISPTESRAYVALPEDSAVAVIDLRDLTADPEILFFPVEVTPQPEEEDMEEVVEEPPEEVMEPVDAEVEPDAPEDAAEEPDADEDVDDGLDAPEEAEGTEDAADEDISEEDAPADDGVPDEDGGIEEDAAVDAPQEDVPAEPPEDADAPDMEPGDETPFYPWHVMVRETDSGTLLVVSGSGSGGVWIMEAARVLEGVETSLVARLLRGTPVQTVAITPSGDFLYAVDRDEGTIHVVDMLSGTEIDTTGGNPLVKQGAVQLDGRATDLAILDLDFGEQVEARVFRGVFAFVAASNGRLYVIDIEDRNCETVCPPHVLRNANEQEESYPFWRGQPTIASVAGQVQYVDFPANEYPEPDYFGELFPSGVDFMYGISFYPYDPWEGVTDPPDIRRAMTQSWTLSYEGVLPYSGGIGGNVEEGGRFVDSGLPLCVVGVRAGDVLVIDDPPSPVDPDADCSAFETAYESPDELEFVITQATQYELLVEPPADRAYGLPDESCFPFAVKYHVRLAAGQWTVVGGATGYLNDWDVDEEGRCTDRLPPCSRWGEEGCTLLNGRTVEDSIFVNPYIKFRLNPLGKALKEETSYTYQGVSGFEPLSISVARYPVSVKYLLWNASLYISDAATEGLVELELEDFTVTNRYF